MPPPDLRARRVGLACALSAYLAWALFPVYFKALGAVGPLQILAHRVVWSMAFLVGLVTVQRRWGAFRGALTLRRLAPYLASTALISVNWGVFIWAVHAGRVLESSLGYFITPLVNVLLGFALLGERLRRAQWLAVFLAALGVVALVARLGALPWISLLLAASFGLYGLVRKRAAIDPVVGLLVETALLAPLAAGYLVILGVRGAGAFGGDARTSALLVGVGILTAVPLILFAVGVRSLRLATMGLLQYVTPTGQFALAVALYREPFTAAHAVAFGLIWASLALYTADALRAESARGREVTPSGRPAPGAGRAA